MNAAQNRRTDWSGEGPWRGGPTIRGKSSPNSSSARPRSSPGARACAASPCGASRPRSRYAAGSIYNAVGDLDAVVLRVNARTLERLRAALVRLVDPARPPIENALAVADGYLDFVARQPRLWGVILEHVLPPGSDFPDWYEKALAATTNVVDEVLKPLVADEDERRRAVATLWASLHGLASLSSSGKLAVVDRDDPRAMAHLLIRRFLGGAARR